MPTTSRPGAKRATIAQDAPPAAEDVGHAGWRLRLAWALLCVLIAFLVLLWAG